MASIFIILIICIFECAGDTSYDQNSIFYQHSKKESDNDYNRRYGLYDIVVPRKDSKDEVHMDKMESQKKHHNRDDNTNYLHSNKHIERLHRSLEQSKVNEGKYDHTESRSYFDKKIRYSPRLERSAVTKTKYHDHAETEGRRMFETDMPYDNQRIERMKTKEYIRYFNKLGEIVFLTGFKVMQRFSMLFFVLCNYFDVL